jgi:hypothetical protein
MALAAACLLLSGACGGAAPPALPTLEAVSPESGPAAGGTPIFVHGSGFLRGAALVTVGGVPAGGLVVLNDTALSCLTPPGVPGSAAVTVTTATGTVARPGAFRYRDRFEGEYFLALFDGIALGGASGLAQWGALAADGAGRVTDGVVITNRDGAIDGPVPLPPIDYAASPANRITTPGASPYFEGGIATSGRVAVLGLVGDGDPVGFMLLGRRGESFVTNADLAGDYHVCAFFFDPATGEDGAVFGTVNCDGFGRGTGSTTTNEGGVLDGPDASDLSYLVLPDGTLSLEWRGRSLSGGVLSGGEVAFASGGTEEDSTPFLVVFVRAGAGLTDATFQGTYHYVSLVGTAGGPGPRWLMTTGTAQADGAGAVVNGGGVTNADGVIGSVGAGGRLPYHVEADGTLRTPSGSPALRGGIVAAGDCACWAGGGGAGEAPQIWLWLR